MVPRSNMPDYGWLEKNKLDPQMIKRKMDVLGFPYTEAEIRQLATKNELDALVAYLQKLGTGIPWREAATTTIVGDLKNPYAGLPHKALEPFEDLYENNCRACHGEHFEGDIGPELDGAAYEDAELFEIIYNGVQDGGMPPFSSLGADKVWKIVNFVKYYNQGEDHH